MINGTVTPLHPYYPLGVVIPGYVAPSMSTLEILAKFTFTCLGILIPTGAYIYTRRRRLSRPDTVAAMWFVLCGFIHLGLEGYFAYHHHDLANMTTTLAQAWKEYSLSDSRYLTSDIFVVCMETITAAFWGPLSFACAWCIVNDHPLRHPLQSIISLGQIYGDILYLGTSTLEFVSKGTEYSRPEAYYFWGYYVFLNIIWIIYPSYLLIQSTRETAKAFAAVKSLENRKGTK